MLVVDTDLKYGWAFPEAMARAVNRPGTSIEVCDVFSQNHQRTDSCSEMELDRFHCALSFSDVIEGNFMKGSNVANSLGVFDCGLSALLRRYWLAAVVVVFAFSLCLTYVLIFGVNVPFWDEWQLLDRFREIYSGRMNWWELTSSKHNEHLVGFAFLVGTLQLLLSGFDSKLQLVSGVLIQTVAFTILAAAIWRTVPESRRPLWVAFSSLVWFSLSQHKNLLWAFQTAWFLVTLLLAITLASLHRAKALEGRSGMGRWLATAAIAALLGSFTSTQGIIIWLAGAVYLLVSENYNFAAFFQRRLNQMWMFAALLAGLAFVLVWIGKGGGGAGGGGEFSLLTSLYIFVGVHGAFLGDVGVFGVAAFGVVMLLFVALALIKAVTAEDRAGYALPVALVAFGLFFVLLVAIGRAKFGTGAARDPHYTAYSLMTYFGTLTILLRQDATVKGSGLIRLAAALFPPMIVIASFSSTYDAVVKGVEWRRIQGVAAATLLKFREVPDFVLASNLFADAGLVRKNAAFLESNRLGVFGDGHAVPEAVLPYVSMSPSMRVWLTRYPDHKAAIEQAWWVYEVGDDLRRAFDPMASDFADKLMTWCYGASRDGGHYLSVYLKPYAADFEAMRLPLPKNPSLTGAAASVPKAPEPQ